MPWRVADDARLWVIPVSFAAVVSGIAATREDRPPADSRMGNLALLLAGSLWLTLVAMAAVGRR